MARVSNGTAVTAKLRLKIIVVRDRLSKHIYYEGGNKRMDTCFPRIGERLVATVLSRRWDELRYVVDDKYTKWPE